MEQPLQSEVSPKNPEDKKSEKKKRALDIRSGKMADYILDGVEAGLSEIPTPNVYRSLGLGRRILGLNSVYLEGENLDAINEKLATKGYVAEEHHRQIGSDDGTDVWLTVEKVSNDSGLESRKN